MCWIEIFAISSFSFTIYFMKHCSPLSQSNRASSCSSLIGMNV